MSKETLNFQTETSELLNLVIHSIYTHKEIFLRELVSNASDAIDKLKFLSITDKNLLDGDQEFKIEISMSKDKNMLKISDNGIGMNHDELISNLGTIARSGSKAFMNALKESKKQSDLEIIGQFGVGFYSAFMVADKITVVTRRAGEEKAYKWESDGKNTFIIEEVKKEKRGTEITLHIRKDEENPNDEYMEEYKIRELVKKYSDYVRYPINLEVEKKEGDKKVKSMETLNSMVPIWKKNKNDVTEEEYNEFYMSKFHDWEKPLMNIHIKVEGNIDYTALLYIPSRTPMDFYTKDYEKGLQLYTKNVFIMDKCKQLVPDHFRFIKGLVDSSDFSLNISREILQQDRQLQSLGKNIQKKIQRELENLLKDDRKKYELFWDAFGMDIKAGIYSEYGLYKDSLKNLLIFHSTFSDDKTTLSEYAERMTEDQKEIYYVSGEDLESLKKMPQMEAVKEKGYEVLFLNERVDEFAIRTLMEFDGKPFKSVTESNLDLEDEMEKKMLEEREGENKELLDEIQKALKDKISKVKLTTRLKSSAVCLVSGENGISFEMERVMKDIPGQEHSIKAERILEINPSHNLFKALKSIFEKSPEEMKEYADILYNQALLVEGFQLEDPVEFSNKITNLLIKASK
ncbi:molecular chaperone HtpG [uncultured Ilyobacter sp.]|uniref:molecular chaperone HtpG n=1 Tax=uncultured Ilyobacter sp. TaxID=544433 RepID=UPI0029C70F61|nr:molecular chaperone HtpG [uncultured Ilyobacter sp.]